MPGSASSSARGSSALAASGLPVAGLDAHAAAAAVRPRGAARRASIPGEAELVDVWLVERVPAWRVREALARVVPPALPPRRGIRRVAGAPALPGPGRRVGLPGERSTPGAVDPAALAAAVDGLPRAAALAARASEGSGDRVLRPAAVPRRRSRSTAPAAPCLRMTLRHDPERGIGRPGRGARRARPSGSAHGARAVTSLVRERLVLAPPPAARAAGAQRPRVRGVAVRPVTPASRPRK